MKTNKRVLLPILLIAITIIAITIFVLDLNIIFNLIISFIVGIASAKVYKSFCNYEGKLYRKINVNQDSK